MGSLDYFLLELSTAKGIGRPVEHRSLVDPAS